MSSKTQKEKRQGYDADSNSGYDDFVQPFFCADAQRKRTEDKSDAVKTQKKFQSKSGNRHDE